MKTKIVILATLLSLNATLILAKNPGANALTAEPTKNEITIDLGKLIPITPLLAEFNDGTEHNATTNILVINLAPITPLVADFEDAGAEMLINIEKLAPETPKESDFEEAEFLIPVMPGTLAPTTPAEADFMQ
jgi:hypothetical protein